MENRRPRPRCVAVLTLAVLLCGCGQTGSASNGYVQNCNIKFKIDADPGMSPTAKPQLVRIWRARSVEEGVWDPCPDRIVGVETIFGEANNEYEITFTEALTSGRIYKVELVSASGDLLRTTEQAYAGQTVIDLGNVQSNE